MRSIARSLFAIAVAGVLAAACTSAGAGAPGTTGSSPAPVAAASPALTAAPTTPAITAPPATPKPMTDGMGEEHVTGVITGATLQKPYTRTPVDRAGDEVTEELRGGVQALTFDMNDVRVSGVGSYAFSIDVYGSVGTDWGTMELTTEDGAWNGPCTGGTWAEGDGLVRACWLTGSGGYEGWTYYLAMTGPSNGDAGGNGIVDGIVYPGTPPEG